MKKQTKCEQLSLFSGPKSENDLLWEAIASLKESHRAVQKRLFAELADAKERIIELSARVERSEYIQGAIEAIEG